MTVPPPHLHHRHSAATLACITAGVAAVMAASVLVHLNDPALVVVLLGLVLIVLAAIDIFHVALPRTRDLVVALILVTAGGHDLLPSVSHNPTQIDAFAVITLTSVVVLAACLVVRGAHRLETTRRRP